MKKKWLKIGVVVTVISLLVTCVAVFAVPGSDGDPLISLSYVDTVLLPKIYAYVDSRISEAGGNNAPAQTGDAASSFKVVNVNAGTRVTCGAGTELILRSGQATIAATQKGGIADTTAGIDLANGTPMPSNHLLVVPLNDGRGFIADTDVIVMVKGSYTVR